MKLAYSREGGNVNHEVTKITKELQPGSSAFVFFEPLWFISSSRRRGVRLSKLTTPRGPLPASSNLEVQRVASATEANRPRRRHRRVCHADKPRGTAPLGPR